MLVFNTNFNPNSQPNVYDLCLKELDKMDNSFQVSPEQSVHQKASENFAPQIWGSEIRKDFANELASIYSKLNDKYHLANKEILEIGSGILINKNSHLSQSFPESKFVFSDKDQELHTTFEKEVDYEIFDLLKNTEKINKLFPVIMGSNVLDTLPYDKISHSLGLIANRLDSEGRFIHIANLNFFKNAFFDTCAIQRPDSNLFPYFSLKSRKIQIFAIDKKKMIAILNERKGELDEKEYEFFIRWNKKHPQIQAVAINNIVGKNIIRNHEEFQSRLETIFSGSLEVLNATPIFEDYLKKAAEANEMEVEECGYHKASSLCSKTTFPYFYKDDPDVHHVSVKNGSLKSKNLDENLLDSQKKVLSKTQGMKTACIHVFVAKKKKVKISADV